MFLQKSSNKLIYYVPVVVMVKAVEDGVVDAVDTNRFTSRQLQSHGNLMHFDWNKSIRFAEHLKFEERRNFSTESIKFSTQIIPDMQLTKQ